MEVAETYEEEGLAPAVNTATTHEFDAPSTPVASTAADENDDLARKIGKVLSPVLQRHSPRLSGLRSPLSPSNSSPKAGKKPQSNQSSPVAPVSSSSVATPKTPASAKKPLAASIMAHVKQSPRLRQLSEKTVTPLRRAVSMVMFSPNSALTASGAKRPRALPSTVPSPSIPTTPTTPTAGTGKTLKRSSSRRSVRSTRSTMSEYPPSKLWQHFADPEFMASLSKHELKRQEKIFELINTEEEYLTDLSMVIEKFAIPMAEKLKSVSEADIEVMFGSLNELILANQTMLEALQQRQFVDNNMFVMHIGDILVDKLHVLGQYSVYCGNMRRASTRLRQLMQLDDVNEFLQDASYSPECRRLSLADFLDMPRRRLMKYGILLNDISSCTPSDHPDFENIKAAIQKMSEVTQKVDVEAGVIDKRNRLMEIIEAIGSSSKLASNERDLLLLSKTIVYEGPLTLAKPAQHVTGILLDNQFLLVREKEKDNAVAYRSVKEPIPISQLQVSDISESQLETVYADVKYAIKITGPEGPYYVSAASQKMKNEWLAHFKTALGNFASK